MAHARDAVRNAADPEQVKRAAFTDREKRALYLAGLRGVMSTEMGRALCWELLAKARVFESIFSQESGTMYYLSGRQDYGHELMADLQDASGPAYLVMAAEARTRDLRERGSNEAAHTAPLKGDAAEM